MKIDKSFKELKYKRDFLFDSKAKEKDYFKNFTDEDEGFSWIDYRENTIKWFDNKLNVIFSWKLLFQKVTYVLATLGLIELFLNPFIGGIIIGVSVVSHIVFLILKKKEANELNVYGFAMTIIRWEIEDKYNLKKLNINPQK